MLDLLSTKEYSHITTLSLFFSEHLVPKKVKIKIMKRITIMRVRLPTSKSPYIFPSFILKEMKVIDWNPSGSENKICFSDYIHLLIILAIPDDLWNICSITEIEHMVMKIRGKLLERIYETENTNQNIISLDPSFNDINETTIRDSDTKGHPVLFKSFLPHEIFSIEERDVENVVKKKVERKFRKISGRVHPDRHHNFSSTLFIFENLFPLLKKLEEFFLQDLRLNQYRAIISSAQRPFYQSNMNRHNINNAVHTDDWNTAPTLPSCPIFLTRLYYFIQWVTIFIGVSAVITYESSRISIFALCTKPDFIHLTSEQVALIYSFLFCLVVMIDSIRLVIGCQTSDPNGILITKECIFHFSLYSLVFGAFALPGGIYKVSQQSVITGGIFISLALLGFFYSLKQPTPYQSMCCSTHQDEQKALAIEHTEQSPLLSSA